MSLNTFNKQISIFLTHIKDQFHDPFQSEIKLDFFNRYYLECYRIQLEQSLKRKILREFKNALFSDIKLSDPIECENSDIIDDLIDLIDD